MEGLREHVDEGDFVDAVALDGQCAEVAGERCWVAGDVDDFRCADGVEQGGDFLAKACAGRIEDDEVGAWFA